MKKSLKKVVLASTFTMFSVAALAHDTAKPAQFVGDVKYASFCEAVVLDDVRVLRNSLSRKVGQIGSNQRQVLRRVMESDGIKCNGENLMEFSKRRNASDIHAFLNEANL